MFKNREEAGKLLIEKLKVQKDENVLVMGIPRGGVVVAKVVAEHLKAPLDIVTIKKIGAPDNPELAIGAVGPRKIVYWDKNLLQRINVPKSQISNLKSQKEREQEDREELLRSDKPYPDFKNRTVILVDDGVATGATVLVAGKFLKKMGCRKILLATPVIAQDTLEKVKKYFSQVLFLEAPAEFYAVGQFYEEFPQVSDEEVAKLLVNSN